MNEVDSTKQDKITIQTGSITIPSGFTMPQNSVLRFGNLVYVNFVIRASTAITSRTTIGTIAEGFRPSRNEFYTFSGSGQVNGFSNRIITGLITPSGEIQLGDGIEPAGQNVIEFRGSITYMVSA